MLNMRMMMMMVMMIMMMMMNMSTVPYDDEAGDVLPVFSPSAAFETWH